MISENDYIKYLASLGITDPEDVEAMEEVDGIEIRLMVQDGDEHEGYYDTIDDAIQALEELRKLYPHLSK